MKIKSHCKYIIITLLFTGTLLAESPYAMWKSGPSTRPDFFMIGVWRQLVDDAQKFKDIGINTYIGVDGDVITKDISGLRGRNMFLVSDTAGSDPAVFKEAGGRTVIGYMTVSEPDNWGFTQIKIKDMAIPKFKPGAKPPVPGRILPADFISLSTHVSSIDANRPIFTYFSQGVANEDYKGRGQGWADEMYAEYVRGSDILGLNLRPITDLNIKDPQKYLWYIGKGLDKLKSLGNSRPMWNFVETTFGKANARPSPEQIKAEVWISLIHGSTGIIYVTHEWKPSPVTNAIFKYADTINAVTKINALVNKLAPVLNTPDVPDKVQVKSMNADIPVDIMVKEFEGFIYIFAAGMRDGKTSAKFTVPNINRATLINVLDESRKIPSSDGIFYDTFKPWDVHIYTAEIKQQE